MKQQALQTLKTAIVDYGMTVAGAALGTTATVLDVQDALARVDRAITAYTRALRKQAQRQAQ